jgi:hypothetical protein
MKTKLLEDNRWLEKRYHQWKEKANRFEIKGIKAIYEHAKVTRDLQADHQKEIK